MNSSMFPNQDFINKYSYRLEDQFGLPVKWAKKLSCTVYSSVLDRNVFMKTKWGRNKLNLWSTLFAPSGSGKSVVWDNDIIPILLDVGKKMETNYFLPSIKSSFEGITDRAQASGLSGCIFRDEITTLFKESRGGYTATILETYSKMYDGWIYPRETRQVHVPEPIAVYVNLIGASTPKYIYETMPAKIFYQGAGNRFDYELWRPIFDEDATVEELHGEDLTPEQLMLKHAKSLDTDQKLFSDILFKTAKYIAEKDFVLCVLDPEAGELSKNYYNSQRKLANSIPDEGKFVFKKEYIVRQWQKMLKYACLMELSKPRLYPEQEDSEVVFISADSIKEATEITRYNYGQFEKIVTEWIGHVRSEDQKLKDDLGIALKYLQTIKAYKLISQKKLAIEIGNIGRNKEFSNIILFLLDAGCIKYLKETKVRRMLQEKSKEWTDNMLVSKFPRGILPRFYIFKKDLVTSEPEKVMKE